jgi:hypothetical protein
MPRTHGGKVNTNALFLPPKGINIQCGFRFFAPFNIPALFAKKVIKRLSWDFRNFEAPALQYRNILFAPYLADSFKGSHFVHPLPIIRQTAELEI